MYPGSVDNRTVYCETQVACFSMIRFAAKANYKNKNDAENKKSPVFQQGMGGKRMILTDLFDFSGANASRADMEPNMSAVRSDRFHELQIGFGYFLRFVVCMTNLIAAELSFTAYLTSTSHC